MVHSCLVQCRGLLFEVSTFSFLSLFVVTKSNQKRLDKKNSLRLSALRHRLGTTSLKQLFVSKEWFVLRFAFIDQGIRYFDIVKLFTPAGAELQLLHRQLQLASRELKLAVAILKVAVCFLKLAVLLLKLAVLLLKVAVCFLKLAVLLLKVAVRFLKLAVVLLKVRASVGFMLGLVP